MPILTHRQDKADDAAEKQHAAHDNVPMIDKILFHAFSVTLPVYRYPLSIYRTFTMIHSLWSSREIVNGTCMENGK
jgi:hypothetical protein